jgi:hypothetical protein
MPPISLTDVQLDAVMRAAAPLAIADRDPFLRAVAEALQGCQELGDGTVYRIVAEAQRRFWDPPLMDHQRRSRRVVAR